MAADSRGFYFHKEFANFQDAHLAEFLTPFLARVKKKFYLISGGDASIKALDLEASTRMIEHQRTDNSHHYFNSENTIYHQNNFLAEFKRLESVNLSKFESFDGYWARDDQRVYVRDQIVPEADPKSFKNGYVGYGTDANFVFWLGPKPFKIANADLKSFKELESSEDGYDAEDKKGAFIGGKRVSKDKN